ncbi:MAG: GlsB/YeaQ/YmgE family stress response membrane protein [Clostridia bacterium]|jgi:uncharacterized membrane protein YeaQ/YmgE (transglycosylase-associated protein family)|nr:GlsB/YeaQ/YmgE family stress response membrane protein [Clostridia bacterium]NLS84397.1 GlsB/YeaQ/YmgE family stress response membrane protein [Oscillospiraceae bacterium]
MIFNIIGWLIVGAVAGYLASVIMGMPGGTGRNIVVGILGSFVGGFIARLIGFYTSGFSIASILVAVAGACLCLWLKKKFLR